MLRSSEIDLKWVTGTQPRFGSGLSQLLYKRRSCLRDGTFIRVFELTALAPRLKFRFRLLSRKFIEVEQSTVQTARETQNGTRAYKKSATALTSVFRVCRSRCVCSIVVLRFTEKRENLPFPPSTLNQRCWIVVFFLAVLVCARDINVYSYSSPKHWNVRSARFRVKTAERNQNVTRDKRNARARL